jgi:hypothetical protein
MRARRMVAQSMAQPGMGPSMPARTRAWRRRLKPVKQHPVGADARRRAASRSGPGLVPSLSLLAWAAQPPDAGRVARPRTKDGIGQPRAAGFPIPVS